MKKYIALFGALIIGLNLSAQDSTSVQPTANKLEGEAQHKAMEVVFKNMVYKDIPISGVLKPNMSMTKYQVDISGNGSSLNGVIISKELKTSFDLTFNDKPITGEMKMPLAGDTHKWDVDFFGNKITGAIKLNLAHTKAIFSLKSENFTVTGEIKDKATMVTYNLKINDKSVKGKVQTQMDKDLTYKLSFDKLNEEEVALFFLIESIRIIALDKESADKFQGR